MDRIDPEEWDVIVIGSGLPECLIASALAAPKDGTSVLLIDEDDTYGSDYASFTLGSMEASAAGKRTGAVGPISDSHRLATEPRPEQGDTGSSLEKKQEKQEEEEEGVREVALPELRLPISEVEIFRLPGVDIGRERAFILDLLPKVCYQAESLVDLLVRTRAHNYMEFKQVEGSYIYMLGASSGKGVASRFAAKGVATPGSTAPMLSPHVTAACPGGALRPVPASKSDVFQDRTLSLMEKRQLMTFIGSMLEALARGRQTRGHMLEALQGGDKLEELMSSGMPLVDLLKAEGLPPRLRDIILYGIACCDANQEPASGPQGEFCPPAPPSTTPHQPLSANQEPASLPQGGTCPPAPPSNSPPQPLSTMRGAASFQLLMHSTGRFGAPGAFMVPGFGCGSITEAFVRFSAVHGATTVLRQRVTQLLVKDGPAPVQLKPKARTSADPAAQAQVLEKDGPGPGQIKPNASASADPAAEGTGTCMSADPAADSAGTCLLTEPLVEEADACTQGTKPTTTGTKTKSDATNTSTAGAGEAGASGGFTPAAPGASGGSHVCGIVTGSGQRLYCKALVAGSRLLGALAPATSSTPPTPASSTTPPAPAPSTTPPTAAYSTTPPATAPSTTPPAPAPSSTPPAPATSSTPPQETLGLAAVISSEPKPQPSERVKSSSPPPAVTGSLSRALAILDGSLVPGKESLMLVFSPSLPRPRRIQPPGSSSPAQISRQELQTALAALVQLEGLVTDSGGRHPSPRGVLSPPSAGATEGAAPTVSSAARSDTVGAAPTASLAASSDKEAAGGGGRSYEGPIVAQDGAGVQGKQAQPKAIQVLYYEQRIYSLPPDDVVKALPSNVVCCGLPHGPASLSAFGLLGYEDVVVETERSFRKHFPDLPWLSEYVQETEQGVGDVGERDEDMALEDLQSALSKLKGAEEGPDPGSPESETEKGGAKDGGARECLEQVERG
eukprot:gene13939-19875_t